MNACHILIRFLQITIIAGLAAEFSLASLCAQDVWVDQRTNTRTDGKIGFIAICGRPASSSAPLSPTGHAFAMTGNLLPDGTLAPSKAEGFYADGVTALFGTTPGHVRDDMKSKSTPNGTCRIVVEVDYDSTIYEDVVSQWRKNPPNYQISNKNCVNMVKDLAVRLHLTVPDDTDLMFPTDFIKAVVNDNGGHTKPIIP